MSPLPSRFFALYYAATAGFVLLDYGFGLNVRLAFLDDLPAWRIAYYIGCGVLFVVIQRFPQSAPLLAAVESLTNLVGLILEMGVRVVVPSMALMERGEGLLTATEVINFLLSGSIAYLSWQSRAKAFWRQTR